MNEKIKEKNYLVILDLLLYQKIIYLTCLPKTRSGKKILRRLLRDLYKKPNEKELGDLSTMVNKDKLKIIRNEIYEQK